MSAIIWEKIIGKKILKFIVNEDKEHFLINFIDGTIVSYAVFGDCCSYSWIEHVTIPDDINGAEILEVKEPEMPPYDNHECKPNTGEDAYGNECGHDHLQFYHVAFETSKGTIILEYRNNSNGYYGGYLEEIRG